MSLEITTSGHIFIDGTFTGLIVGQKRRGTIVYTPEYCVGGFKVHEMPHNRYSLACDNPISGVAGGEQFESDIRELLSKLNPESLGIKGEIND